MRVGNYTLSELLGRGGTSEVYAAQHAFLGDAVAVKLLRTGPGDDTQAREAFVAEATRTREIEHPNVVRVIDVGHDEATGSCYLVMERIDGETLAARLRRVGRLDEPTLRRLAAAIADGMQAAHARGIVHRDLKPGNVMLRSSDGEVPTIVDFGIAKSLGGSSAVHTERRIGTVAYMAPEQLADGLITPAADIWALGVLMYEAATGQLPFGNFADGRLPQLFDTPPRAATLAPMSPALDDLIARCLERDPGKRPVSMADIARALRITADPSERVTADLSERVTADVALPDSRVRAPSAPRSRKVLLAAGAILVGLFGIVMAVARSRDADPREPPAVISPPPAAAAPEAIATPLPVDAGVGAAIRPPPAHDHARARKKRRVTATPEPRTTSQGETLD